MKIINQAVFNNFCDSVNEWNELKCDECLACYDYTAETLKNMKIKDKKELIKGLEFVYIEQASTEDLSTVYPEHY